VQKIAIETEGEHAAQGGATALAVTGKRVVNFTSGQGIVYAMEQYYHAPGKLSTMVLEVGARALTKHALNVHCGHDDIYAALDTGWTMLMAKDAQQAADQAVVIGQDEGRAIDDGHVAAGAGADTLVASAGNTTLSGGTSTGNNTFFAGTGDGVLVGGGVGNDTIFGGRGESTLFGGSGSDVFAFFNSQMKDNPGHKIIIGDFTVGQDKLVFDGYSNVSILLPQQDAGSTTLTLPDGTKIVLQGVSLTGNLG
jgi:hypothetical protein